MTELAEKVNQSLASAAEQMKGISEIIGKNLSILNEKSANLGNLKEKSELKSEIAQIEEIMNWTVRLTKAPISKFDAERQKMTNRAFEDLLNSTETISDFVVHKKKEILEQETNEQKKQEITDSISKSEEAKEIRIQQQKDYLKTALESQEKWREKALKGYEEMEEGITKLLNEVKEEIEKVKSL